MTAPSNEAIEAAARGMFASEQCDLRQKQDLEANWLGRLSDHDRDEYRRLTTAALSAAYPFIVAQAKAEALRDIERGLFDIESQHHIHGVECLCGFKSHRSRSRTEHITGLVRTATIEGKDS